MEELHELLDDSKMASFSIRPTSVLMIFSFSGFGADTSVL